MVSSRAAFPANVAPGWGPDEDHTLVRGWVGRVHMEIIGGIADYVNRDGLRRLRGFATKNVVRVE